MWLFSILAMLLILPVLMLLRVMLALAALVAVLVLVVVVEFHLERTIPKTDRAFPAAYAAPDGDCNRGPRN